MSHISFVKAVHPDAAMLAQSNKDIGPSAKDIRSTVRAQLELCSRCEKKQNAETKLRKCSRCLISRYCSKECQVSDWPTHKEACADRGSSTHLKLTKRLVANNILMYQVQLYAILDLDLLNTPANTLEQCLSIAVDTDMPANPMAQLQAQLRGEVNPDSTYLLWVRTMEKKPIDEHSTPAARERQRSLHAELTRDGMGDWPVVLLVFTSAGSTILEIPYAIDPQAMQHCREKRPSVQMSGISGRVEIPLSRECAREDLNNLTLMDKSNQYLLRTKSKHNTAS
ncbi:hypothetical protein C8R46DRAFT_1121707 [Mycena filopes]|nr:hypothetical protein C8R46DRAFT_1121707 [Mycena filopes]